MARAAGALCLVSWASLVLAQPPVADDSRSELLRVLVAESRWNTTRSHAAMLHVLRRFAIRHDLTATGAADRLVWAYSNAQADHPWIRYLSGSCERPDYYKGTWPRDKCLRVVDFIDSFESGRVADPCAGQASGWRSPKSKALRYALRHGYRRVRCVGGTTLAFVKEARHER